MVTHPAALAPGAASLGTQLSSLTASMTLVWISAGSGAAPTPTSEVWPSVAVYPRKDLIRSALSPLPAEQTIS